MHSAHRVQLNLKDGIVGTHPPRETKSIAATLLRYFMEIVRTSVPGNGRMRAEMWGLNPTYDSPAFEKFTSILLEWNYKCHDIRNAKKHIEANPSSNCGRPVKILSPVNYILYGDGTY